MKANVTVNHLKGNKETAQAQLSHPHLHSPPLANVTTDSQFSAAVLLPHTTPYSYIARKIYLTPPHTQLYTPKHPYKEIRFYL